MTTPQIYSDYNSYYLIQDLQGLNKYQRAKAIDKFVSKGTKLLEMYLDSELEKIFAENHILFRYTDKATLNRAYNELNKRGKGIWITDLFGGKDFYKCEHLITTNSKMTIIIEEDRYIETGVRLDIIDWSNGVIKGE